MVGPIALAGVELDVHVLTEAEPREDHRVLRAGDQTAGAARCRGRSPSAVSLAGMFAVFRRSIPDPAGWSRPAQERRPMVRYHM